MTFIYEMHPSLVETNLSYLFIFRERDLLVVIEENKAFIPLLSDISEIKLTFIRKQYFGVLNDYTCYYLEVQPNVEPPEKMTFLSLRRLFELLEDNFLWIAGRASQLLNWDRTTQYCGQCSSHTIIHPKDNGKICPRCNLVSFPQISPAIIIGILKGNKILLANGTRFKSSIYSVLAGFVEPGESLEECVEREVKEEVGIGIENLRYFGSQSWPFPNSLMIGFLADYKEGELSINQDELIDANWFTKDELPPIPSKISIARRIIDWFIENC